jgi:hypothetical protein
VFTVRTEREKKKRWREEHNIQHSRYSDNIRMIQPFRDVHFTPDAALGALDLLITFNATSFIPLSPVPSLSLSLSLPPPRPRTDLDDVVRDTVCRMRERPLLDLLLDLGPSSPEREPDGSVERERSSGGGWLRKLPLMLMVMVVEGWRWGVIRPCAVFSCGELGGGDVPCCSLQ